ncbi:hypothetical protein [Streptomyces noursei]|uniref:hypothetical protein n=1 Tax=Streptomyces noursei TaxID=1971 RepID=UPI0023B83F49|nr:hypothetical protein [Streptomyces noursei]
MTAPPLAVDAAHRLRGVRTAYNDHIAELFPRHQRLVSYVIRPPGADVSAVQSQLRTLAEEHGRYVGYDITDEAACSLRKRVGFAEARDLVYRGWAHGLVVPNQATISENLTVYRTQVHWFGERNALLYVRDPEETE